MNSIGRALILAGLIFVLLGVIVIFGARIPWLGRLPGDIYVQKKNFTFFFPITTSIILSIVISLILMLLRKR
jgi:uncharacterized protein HemY